MVYGNAPAFKKWPTNFKLLFKLWCSMDMIKMLLSTLGVCIIYLSYILCVVMIV